MRSCGAGQASYVAALRPQLGFGSEGCRWRELDGAKRSAISRAHSTRAARSLATSM